RPTLFPYTTLFRSERRLVRLRAAGAEGLRPRAQHRLLRPRADLQQRLVHGRSAQLHRHDLQAPGAGDVAEPDAALLLRDAGGLVLADLRAAGALVRPDL